MSIICGLFDMRPSLREGFIVESRFRRSIGDSNSDPIPRSLSLEFHCSSGPDQDVAHIRMIVEECRRKSQLVAPDREVRGMLCDLGYASQAEIEAGRSSIEYALRCFPTIGESCRPTVVLMASGDIGAVLAALSADRNIQEIIVCIDSLDALQALLGSMGSTRRRLGVRNSRHQHLTVWVKASAAKGGSAHDDASVAEILRRETTQFDAINVIAPLLWAESSQKSDQGEHVRSCFLSLLRTAADLGMEWVAPGMFYAAPPHRRDRSAFSVLNALDVCRNSDTLAVGPGSTSHIADTYFENFADCDRYASDIAGGGLGIHHAFKVNSVASLRQAVMLRLASRAVVDLKGEAATANCAIPAISAAFEQALNTLARRQAVVRHCRAVFGLPPGSETQIGEVHDRLLQTTARLPDVTSLR